MKRSKYMQLQEQAAELAQQVFAWVKPQQIEIAWFGRDDDESLLGLINVFNEEGFCCKILILLPGWVCPSHWHLSERGEKNEGFLVLHGALTVRVPEHRSYTFYSGQTLFLPAGTEHELSSGSDGVVFIEVSDRDERIDLFRDQDIVRDPVIEEDVEENSAAAKGFSIMGDAGRRLEPHHVRKTIVEYHPE